MSGINYAYPKHCDFPEGKRNFFGDHLHVWDALISGLIENGDEKESRIAIEIGSLYGACSVWLLDKFTNRPMDTLHCIDINQTKYLKTNLEPYKNAQFHLGASGDVLCELWCKYKAPVADLIYIDGSHLPKHILEDAVIGWKLLKVGGVMVFDDYGWGAAGESDDRPRTGIDAFRFGFQKHYELLDAFNQANSYQLYLQKIQYQIKDVQLEGNYANDNPFFNENKV